MAAIADARVNRRIAMFVVWLAAALCALALLSALAQAQPSPTTGHFVTQNSKLITQNSPQGVTPTPTPSPCPLTLTTDVECLVVYPDTTRDFGYTILGYNPTTEPFTSTYLVYLEGAADGIIWGSARRGSATGIIFQPDVTTTITGTFSGVAMPPT